MDKFLNVQLCGSNVSEYLKSVTLTPNCIVHDAPNHHLLISWKWGKSRSIYHEPKTFIAFKVSSVALFRRPTGSRAHFYGAKQQQPKKKAQVRRLCLGFKDTLQFSRPWQPEATIFWGRQILLNSLSTSVKVMQAQEKDEKKEGNKTEKRDVGEIFWNLWNGFVLLPIAAKYWVFRNDTHRHNNLKKITSKNRRNHRQHQLKALNKTIWQIKIKYYYKY